jgi:hypothetical protein
MSPPPMDSYESKWGAPPYRILTVGLNFGNLRPTAVNLK